VTQAEQQRQATRQRRLARYEGVIALHQQGHSLRAISRQLGLGFRTVQRYVNAGAFPEMAQRQKGPTLLTPYQAYLQTRWAEGMHNGAQLFREIREQGYPGSRLTVGLWAAAHKRLHPPPASAQKPQKPPPQPPAPRPWSARFAAWLFLKSPQQLSAAQQAALQRMRQASPAIDHAYRFAQAFGRIIRHRFSKALDPWLQAVRLSDLVPLKRFAKGLKRDYSAVHAALTLPYSNGPTEGHVNRLKLIKRSMYGRAKFDLLRHRVLAPI
jgi:transposase